MKICALYNIKGGVGKTAGAVNLAYFAAGEGMSTLVWDLDPQGAASFYFRVKAKVKGGQSALIKRKRDIDDAIKATDYPNLDLLPADFSYRNMDLSLSRQKKPENRLQRLLKPLSEEYDLVILDCPPSISLVSENVFQAADMLLVPLIPTVLSLRTFSQLRGFLKKSENRPQLLPFFSMADKRKKLHCDVMAHLFAAYPKMPQTPVPYASDVEKMGIKRMPLPAYAPTGAATQAYAQLWDEVKRRL